MRFGRPAWGPAGRGLARPGALPAVDSPPMELPKPLQNLSRTLYSSPSTPWNLLELPKRHTACQKPPKISPGPLPDSRPGALPAVDSPPGHLPKPVKNLSKTLYNSPNTPWNLLELPKSPTTSQKPPKTSPGPLPDRLWNLLLSYFLPFLKARWRGSQLCCALDKV